MGHNSRRIRPTLSRSWWTWSQGHGTGMFIMAVCNRKKKKMNKMSPDRMDKEIVV